MSRRGEKRESISVKGHEDFVSLEITIPIDSFPPWGSKKVIQPPGWGDVVQLGSGRSAPQNIPTPFCENRYRNLVALAERCCYFCDFFPSISENRVIFSLFSLFYTRLLQHLHTAYAHLLLKFDSANYQISKLRRSAIWQIRKNI